MSHYTVLVVGANVARQLAPFKERTINFCGCTDQAKWDWYKEGGRWPDLLASKKTGRVQHRDHKMRMEDLDVAASDLPTYALLKDGIWHEQGSVTWFGGAKGEKSDGAWKEEFMRLLATVRPRQQITVVDCHI